MPSFPLAIPSLPNQGTLAGYHGNTGPMSKLIGDANDEIEALAARVGTTSSTDTYSLDYQIRKVERSYTPVASTPTGSLTMPCTWTGHYTRPDNGKEGSLAITGIASGTWSVASGTPFLELTMPSGWTAAASHECAKGYGLAYPASNPYGLHYKVYPVVHAGATKIRFIATTGGGDGTTSLAIDGVNFGPFPSAVVNGDTVFDGTFDVRLA